MGLVKFVRSEMGLVKFVRSRHLLAYKSLTTYTLHRWITSADAVDDTVARMTALTARSRWIRSRFISTVSKADCGQDCLAASSCCVEASVPALTFIVV